MNKIVGGYCKVHVTNQSWSVSFDSEAKLCVYTHLQNGSSHA